MQQMAKTFIQKLATYSIPDILLLDISMPEMDGYTTAEWVKANHPEIKNYCIKLQWTQKPQSSK